MPISNRTLNGIPSGALTLCRPSVTSASRETARAAWQRPAFEVVCLACEISAYAPDEGEPLF
jgi:hypothetical protein